MGRCPFTTDHTATAAASLLRRMTHQLLRNVVPTLLLLTLLGWLALSAARQIDAGRMAPPYSADSSR